MTDRIRVVIGCDDAGYEYKTAILADLMANPGVTAIDYGVDANGHTPYPSVAIKAAEAIVAGQADRAILICGTGLGMAITANKVPTIRATTVHDSYSAERSIMSNNAQIMTMGQRVIGMELARRLAREWLGYTFDPGSASARKIALIDAFEAGGA